MEWGNRGLRTNTRTSVCVATSLDGYIARKDGRLDGLGDATEPDGEDFGYQAFVDSVDVLVMGRRTFEQVMTFAGWPYGGTPVVVLANLVPDRKRRRL